MRYPCLILILIVAASSAFTQQTLAVKETTYKSPDGALVAIVKSTNLPDAANESEVRVQDTSGKILLSRDYRSKDGQHGYSVAKVQWTPDSQFFVYSLVSSGGHSPWHSPIEYFSRKSGKFASLDDALGNAVTNPQFSVSAPDNVTVELYFGNKTQTVSLSSLTERIPLTSEQKSKLLELPERSFRPKLLMQDALAIAQKYIETEKIDVRHFWLFSAKWTLLGDPNAVPKNRVSGWYFWWRSDTGETGNYVELFVSIDGKCHRIPSM